MDLPYNVYITEEDVLKRGYSLKDSLALDDQGEISKTVDAFLTEVASSVYNLILDLTKDTGIATAICQSVNYSNDIAYAQLEQAIYILENGNLLATSGEGTQLTLEDIRGQKAYSAIAYNHLKSTLKYLFGGIC